MKNLQSATGERCPFEFNMKPESFKPGDFVSYRVPGYFGDTPFVGQLISVHSDHVVLRHLTLLGDGDVMRASREERPAVSDEEAFKESKV